MFQIPIYSCQYGNHTFEPITGYCFNQNCFFYPQFCQRCQLEKHDKHRNDCKSLQQIRQMIPEISAILTDSELKVGEIIKTLMRQYQDIQKLLIDEKNSLIELGKQLEEQNFIQFNQNFNILKQWALRKKGLDTLNNIDLPIIQTQMKQ